MKEFKDIGKSIEERFEGAQRQPSEGLWGRIDDTLKRKRRRRLLVLFFSGLVATIVVGIGIYQQIGKTKEAQPYSYKTIDQNTSSTQKELQATTIDSISNKNTSKEISNLTTKKDSFSIEPNQVGKSLTKENQNKRNTQEATKISETQKKKNSVLNTQILDTDDPFKGFEKKTTYYYYSSKDSVAISSDNKKTIDSIMKQAEIVIDTIKK